MNKNTLITHIKEMIEKNISKIGHDGTRYYTFSREELEEIIEELEE